MNKFKIISTDIPDIKIISTTSYHDDRGAFTETYSKSALADLGIRTDEFIQDNHSVSKKGVIRGIHYQLNPKAQGKLVRVVRGGILDFAIDLRSGSPTFGKYTMATLTPCNGLMFWIPAGFGHAFIALYDNTEVLYKTTAEYSPEYERGISPFDPDVNIDWCGLSGISPDELIISKKDLEYPELKHCDLNFKQGE